MEDNLCWPIKGTADDTFVAKFRNRKVEDYRGFFHANNEWWEVDLEWLVQVHPYLEHSDCCIFYRKKDDIFNGVENIFLNPTNLEIATARKDAPLHDGFRSGTFGDSGFRLNLNEAIIRGEIKPLPKEYFQKRVLFWYVDSYMQSKSCLIHKVIDGLTLDDLDKIISQAKQNISRLQTIRNRFRLTDS